jgi:hypothetical protein
MVLAGEEVALSGYSGAGQGRLPHGMESRRALSPSLGCGCGSLGCRLGTRENAKVDKVLLILAILSLVLVGCPLVQSPPAKEYGTLVLTVSSDGMAGKNILPPLDMDVAYYDVYGDGPDPSTFSYPGITGPTFVESSLIAGEWMITVDAFNADDDLIGSGSVVVTIIPGQTAQAEVLVAPLEGTGSLQISISWPAGTVASPAVTGTLTAVGSTPQSIPFTMEADSASYSVSALEVGYYSLAVQLYDGGSLKWGMFEGVRILKDQLTEALLTLTAEDVS